MKNKYAAYTSWDKYEKKLFKNKNFSQTVNETEPEYLIAKSLIEARRKKKLSQQQLALKAGTKQPVISRIESGTHKPSLSILKRLAQALDTHLIIRFD